jgi:hypothetical protein
MPQQKQPTTEKLAAALIEAGAPQYLVDGALAGKYDDFKSDLDLPITTLVADLTEAARNWSLPNGVRSKLAALVDRVKNGEFDATREEAEAWARREGIP